MTIMDEISAIDLVFAEHVASGMSDTEAYRRTRGIAKGQYRTVNVCRWAYEVARKPEVQKKIRDLKLANSEKHVITRSAILEQLLLVAFADPRELVQHFRYGCRHCNGFEHGYQWQEDEYLAKLAAAEQNEEPLPDLAGGFGFLPDADPHPECPKCGGRGVGETVIADTRFLSPAAAALYAGIKSTTSGIEVLFNDQFKAREKVAKMLGYDADVIRVGIEVPDDDTIKNLTAVEAALVYKRIMGTAH